MILVEVLFCCLFVFVIARLAFLLVAQRIFFAYVVNILHFKKLFGFKIFYDRDMFGYMVVIKIVSPQLGCGHCFFPTSCSKTIIVGIFKAIT